MNYYLDNGNMENSVIQKHNVYNVRLSAIANKL